MSQSRSKHFARRRWRRSADAFFAEVFVERVPFAAFTGEHIDAIREIARVLQPGGRVIIETGILAPVTQLREALRKAGFKNIRTTTRGLLRVTARLGGGT